MHGRVRIHARTDDAPMRGCMHDDCRSNVVGALIPPNQSYALSQYLVGPLRKGTGIPDTAAASCTGRQWSCGGLYLQEAFGVPWLVSDQQFSIHLVASAEPRSCTNRFSKQRRARPWNVRFGSFQRCRQISTAADAKENLRRTRGDEAGDGGSSAAHQRKAKRGRENPSRHAS
jgi:hypothetical protein